MEKFYKGTNDIMFKTIFCDPKNRKLLKRLIEDAMLLENIEILEVNIPELPKHNLHSKGRILDVVVKSDKRTINIEINRYDDIIFHRRNFSYLAQLYTDELKIGEKYSDQKDYVQLNISVSNSSDIPELEIYKLIGQKYHNLFIDNFTIYEFNLPKMKKACYNDYKFLQMLDYDKEELIKHSKGDEDMENYNKEIQKLNSDSKFIEFLTAEEEEEKYINTVKDLEFKAGVKEGIEKGIKKGSISKTKDIALNLLKLNLNIKDISQATGLTEEEIENLKE